LVGFLPSKPFPCASRGSPRTPLPRRSAIPPGRELFTCQRSSSSQPTKIASSP